MLLDLESDSVLVAMRDFEGAQTGDHMGPLPGPPDRPLDNGQITACNEGNSFSAHYINFSRALLQKLIGEFVFDFREGNLLGILAGILRDFFGPTKFRKILVVRNIFVCNSGAGNGCVYFMDAWKNAFFQQEKPMSIKFLVSGGGGILGFWGGGGSADFIFMGRADLFLKNKGC